MWAFSSYHLAYLSSYDQFTFNQNLEIGYSLRGKAYYIILGLARCKCEFVRSALY